MICKKLIHGLRSFLSDGGALRDIREYNRIKDASQERPVGVEGLLKCHLFRCFYDLFEPARVFSEWEENGGRFDMYVHREGDVDGVPLEVKAYACWDKRYLSDFEKLTEYWRRAGEGYFIHFNNVPYANISSEIVKRALASNEMLATCCQAVEVSCSSVDCVTQNSNLTQTPSFLVVGRVDDVKCARNFGAD